MNEWDNFSYTAAEFEKLMIGGGEFKDYTNIINVVRKHPDFEKRKISIVDLGCGVASLYSAFKKQKIENNILYTGVEGCTKYINCCRERHPGISFIETNAELYTSDQMVDMVVCKDVLIYIKKPKEFLDRIAGYALSMFLITPPFTDPGSKMTDRYFKWETLLPSVELESYIKTLGTICPQQFDTTKYSSVIYFKR